MLTQADEAAGSGGVYRGPWPLTGGRLPGLTGVLTFTVRGEAVSVRVEGRIGDSNGVLTLVLEPQTPDGAQLVLTPIDEHRLAGTGTSRPTWQPQGPVDLVRQR